MSQQRDLPSGWDAADAVADGWTAARLAKVARWLPVSPAPATHHNPERCPDLRPDTRSRKGANDNETTKTEQDDAESVIPGPNELPSSFYVERGAIVFRKPHEDGIDENGKIPRAWEGRSIYVSPLFRVLAVTRDERGDDFGRLIVFKDLDQRYRREVIMDRERAGQGDALRARLAAAGLEGANNPDARRHFSELLRRWAPKARARSVTRTGWTMDGLAFVLPDKVLGRHSEDVILVTEGERPAFGTRGTLDEWRKTVGAWCVGNSRLTFAVSLAFAAPCLQLTDAESGGFHLVGSSVDASSSGKTTVQRVAASVCGSPEYLQRWRATDNAIEGLAELHNDSLLILDELNQMDPKAAGETAHMLGNGVGKSRMERTAVNRAVKRWRLLFLSSGEIGLAEHMASVSRKTRAGQEVRMAEIPADAGAGLGVFETLHGHANGATFAVALKDAAAAHYGHPLLSFISALMKDRAGITAAIKQHQAGFVVDVLREVDAAGGQVRRVAARFGLVAVAGELATLEGITGWPEGASYQAAKRCFNDWLSARGGTGPTEELALLAQVRLFFERHSNRLRWKSRVLDDHAPEVAMLAGFKEQLPDGGIVFNVLPETFRQEVIAGFNERDAGRVLIRHGLLQPGSGGRTTQKIRLPDRPTPARVYVFHLDTITNEP